MGMFSWKCCKCGEPIFNNSTRNNWHKAILVTPDNLYYEDDYKGYGIFDNIDAYTWLYCNYNDEPLVEETHPDNEIFRIGGINLWFSPMTFPRNGIRIVHQDCYNGETYESLKNSEDDENQGWDQCQYNDDI